MITPIIKDHRLYRSENYKKLSKNFKNESLYDFAQENDFFKLILNIIVDNQRIINREYFNALEREIILIKKHNPNFEKFFVFYEELSFFLKNNYNIYNIGRGRSASSVLCYALGITNLDPIDHELDSRLFCVDIDIDVDVPDRKMIINFFKKKYKKNMAYWETVSRNTIKGAFKKVMRDELNKKNLFDSLSKIDNYLTISPFLNLINYYESTNNQSMISILQKEEIKFYEKKYSKEYFKFLINYDKELSSLIFKEEKEKIINLIGEKYLSGIHAGALIFSDNITKFDLTGKQLIDGEYKKESNLDIPILKQKELENNINELVKVDILNLKVLSRIQNKDLVFNKLINFKRGKYFQTEYIQDLEEKEYSILNFTIELIKRFPQWIDNNPTCPKRFQEILMYSDYKLLFQEDVLKIGDLFSLDSVRFFKNLNSGIIEEKYYKIFSQEEIDFLLENVKKSRLKSHYLSYSYYSKLDMQ